MMAIFVVLILPLSLLNLSGGIGSGIWLAILGEYWAIGYGLVGLFSHFLLATVIIPGLVLAGPAAVLVGKGKTFLAFPLLLLSQLYTYAVITVWCMFVFYMFTSQVNEVTYWPLLIWSYSVALGPWNYLAHKETQGGRGDGLTITTFFAQVAYLVVALVVIFSSVTLMGLAVIFGVIMLAGMLIQTGIALAMLREERRLSIS